MDSSKEMLDQLLVLTRDVASIGSKIDHLEEYIAAQGESLIEIRNNQGILSSKHEDYTVRIRKLEDREESNTGKWTRLTGVWVGVALTITTMASMAALWKAASRQ